MIFSKSFDGVQKGDIEDIVARAVPEGRELDYKQELPGNSDRDKAEFLSDVCSFANATGGYLLYGVVERRDNAGKPTGEPAGAPGLATFNADETILRLETMARDGIEPRIAGFRAKAVPGLNNGSALLAYVPISWARPHMVKGSSRFYSRGNRGKFQMDVYQIRTAFSESEQMGERLKAFRTRRILNVGERQNLPTELSRERAAWVLHLVPASALGPAAAVDILAARRDIQMLMPPGWRSAESSGERLNFDGYARTINGIAYVQLFRSGAIEAVETQVLNSWQDRRIPWPTMEREIVEAATGYFAALRRLEVAPPLFVMLTLLGVREFRICPEANAAQFFPTAGLDRSELKLQEVVTEDLDNVDAATLLRPIFDTLWQACGRERSLSYGAEGQFVVGQR